MTKTYLVVAHRTLVGEHLLEHVRGLADSEETRFHLVVPVRHPTGHAWTDGEIEGIARQKLEEGLYAFRASGLDVSGEVGDENPVYATSTAMRNIGFDCDGIIVSTLPTGVSHWLRIDVVSRMRREFDLPITHLLSDRVSADVVA